MKIIALIPARKASKRIPNKNFKPLAGVPLIEYAVKSAIESRAFSRIIVNSNADEAESVTKKFHIDCIKRPDHMSGQWSNDIDWIKHTMEIINYDCDLFVILRPTSPFRTAGTIKRALSEFNNNYCYTSLKSMHPVKERPEKMWYLAGNNDGHAIPYIQQATPIMVKGSYTYEMQSSNFPNLYIQNGCIDICKPSTVMEWHSYIGFYVYPFFTRGLEGFDINTSDDWDYAEYLIGKMGGNNANNLLGMDGKPQL